MKLVIVVLAIIIFFVDSLYCDPIGQTNDVENFIIELMKSKGFENIRVSSSNGILAVEYENRVYFREVDALNVIIPDIINKFPDLENLILFPKKDNVPLVQLSVTKDNYQAPSENPRKLSDQVTISKVPKDFMQDEKTHNSSIGKIDITIHPFGNILLGRFNDPFISEYAVIPEFSSFLGNGLIGSARLYFLINDEKSKKRRKIGLDGLFIRYTYRQAILKEASLFTGYFGENHYGIGSNGIVFGGKNKIGVGGSIAFLGNMYYIDKYIYYTKLWNWTAWGDVYYLLPSLNMAITASFGRFLYQDNGISLSIARFFNNASVGVFATRTSRGRNYGLGLQLLTYPRQNLKPYYIRIKLPTVISTRYNYSESIAGTKFSYSYNKLNEPMESFWLVNCCFR